MKKLICAALAGITALSPASAMQIFDFTARVDFVNDIVPVGTMVSGKFGYDEHSTVTSEVSNGDGAVWIYDHKDMMISVNFDEKSYHSAAAYILKTDPITGSYHTFAIMTNNAIFAASIYVWDPSSEFMIENELPTEFVALAQGPFSQPTEWESLTVPFGEFTFYDPLVGRPFIATILSITSAAAPAVPEPATWAMMLAGFGLVGVAMRRRSKAVAAIA